MTLKINPNTPLGQLLSEKREIGEKCRESEAHIKQDWQYIRSHAGRLMLAELSAIVMPHRKDSSAIENGSLRNNPWINMAWRIAKPIAYRWMGEVGWQVFKSMFRKKR